MAKRKATTSTYELQNGGGSPEEKGASQNPAAGQGGSSSGGNPTWDTPKRAFGGEGGGGVAPSSLSFEANPGSAGGGSKFVNLGDQVSEKMSKVNEAFVTGLGWVLKSQPDAILFPMLESYIKHVHSILAPNLPSNLAVLDQDKDVASFLRLFDQLKSAMESKGGSGGIGGSSAASKSVVGTGGNGAGNTKPTVVTPPVGLFRGIDTQSLRAGDGKYSKGSLFATDVKPVTESGSSSASAPFAKLFDFGKTNGALKPDPPAAMVVSTFNFRSELTSQPEPVASTSGTNNNDAGGEDEEAEEPPKVEFNQVKEEDALYETRCKVYGKLDGAFKDRGVGQLFLKKLESGKHQLVVRAANTLGTILLNILLQDGLPLSSKGKDVITCDPTGDKGNPQMIIVRVKNEEAANELLAELKACLSKPS